MYLSFPFFLYLNVIPVFPHHFIIALVVNAFLLFLYVPVIGYVRHRRPLPPVFLCINRLPFIWLNLHCSCIRLALFPHLNMCCIPICLYSSQCSIVFPHLPPITGSPLLPCLIHNPSPFWFFLYNNLSFFFLQCSISNCNQFSLHLEYT